MFFLFAPIAARKCQSPETTPINAQTHSSLYNYGSPTTAALLIPLYHTHKYAFVFLWYRSYLIFIKIILLRLSCWCCLLCCAAVLLLILRHMLSFSSLASPSFDLLAYLSSLFFSLPFPATFMCSAWVVHLLFILPSILPTYVSPPSGEVV